MAPHHKIVQLVVAVEIQTRTNVPSVAVQHTQTPCVVQMNVTDVPQYIMTLEGIQ